MADTRIDELRRRLERDPGSRLFAQLAEELRKSGHLAEAIRVARAGLAVHPAYPSARLTLGRALLDSGDATGGRSELESAFRDAPDNIQASRYLAQAREKLGDLKGAAEQYRQTLLMAPEDRQLQAALAALQGRLGAAGGQTSLATEATPLGARRPPPPLPAQGTGATLPPLGAAPAGQPRAGAPPVVFAPSRPATAPEPDPNIDFSSDGGALAPTLRIHASQTAAPAVLHPAPPPPPAPVPAGLPVAAEEPTPGESPESSTLPTDRVEAQAPPTTEAAPAPEDPASASTTPFSSSTLAELYFQQGLVERAADVYRQLLEQEPENEKARQRLAEIERPAPVADDRAARRRALQRTIAGLEALLGAVRAR